MRTSILGIHDWWDTDAVEKNAVDICKVTHRDPRYVAFLNLYQILLHGYETQIKYSNMWPFISRVLDCVSKDCLFVTHHWRSHCVVSLSKTLYPLFSIGSTQEDSSQHD